MVSIIIPAYNYADYLPEALNSLLAQSFNDWECIIVNNGSTDETEKIACDFEKQDSRFRYFTIENHGVSAARNFALSKAKGEFIQFLDADDTLEKDKLKVQVEYLQKITEADLVYGETRYFRDGNNKEIRLSMHEKDVDWLPRISSKGPKLVTSLLKRNIFPINAAIFKKSLLNKSGMFNENMKGLEDWDFWLRFALNNACFHYRMEKDSTALVRIHAISASNDKRMMHLHILPFLWRYFKHKGINYRQKLYLFIRFNEELLDYLILSHIKLKEITSDPEFKGISIYFLMGISILFLPLYLLLKTYRKLFQ